MIARITTIDANNPHLINGETVFDASLSWQAFLSTGLLNALLTTIIGSLCFRIVASATPLTFLSNRLINVMLRLCLNVCNTGIMDFAWLCAKLVASVLLCKADNSYLSKTQITTESEEIESPMFQTVISQEEV